MLCLKGPPCHGAKGSLRLRAERGGGAHPDSPGDGVPTAQRQGSAEDSPSGLDEGDVPTTRPHRQEG